VARANPEAVVAMLYGQHEELRPAGMETAEIIEQLTPGLEARLENMSPVDGLDGNADVSQIEGHVEAMVESGTFELPSGQSVEEFVKDFWDPSLLEEANDFDKAALMAEAEQWSWDDFIE